MVFLQAVFLRQFHDDRLDFLVGPGENLSGHFLHCLSHIIRQRLHGLTGRVGISVGKIFRLNQSQDIGRAGVCDGDALAVFQFNGHIVVRVAFLGAEEYHLGLHNLLFWRKHRIIHSRDMGGTGAYVLHSVLVRPDHASAGHTQNPHIQAADISPVASYDGVVNSRTSVLNHADIGGGAAHLKVHSVGGPQVHQASHHRGRRAGKHGQDRSLFHLADFHYAAIASHNHQRNLHAGAAYALLRGIGGSQHLGKDGGVDGRRAGASRKSVKLGNLAGRRSF